MLLLPSYPLKQKCTSFQIIFIISPLKKLFICTGVEIDEFYVYLSDYELKISIYIYTHIRYGIHFI